MISFPPKNGDLQATKRADQLPVRQYYTPTLQLFLTFDVYSSGSFAYKSENGCYYYNNNRSPSYIRLESPRAWKSWEKIEGGPRKWYIYVEQMSKKRIKLDVNDDYFGDNENHVDNGEDGMNGNNQGDDNSDKTTTHIRLDRLGRPREKKGPAKLSKHPITNYFSSNSTAPTVDLTQAHEEEHAKAQSPVEPVARLEVVTEDQILRDAQVNGAFEELTLVCDSHPSPNRAQRTTESLSPLLAAQVANGVQQTPQTPRRGGDESRTPSPQSSQLFTPPSGDSFTTNISSASTSFSSISNFFSNPRITKRRQSRSRSTSPCERAANKSRRTAAS